MTEEIKQVIEKHLPAQVGKALQERLALVDSLESQVKTQRDRISDLERQKSALVETVAMEAKLNQLRESAEKRLSEAAAKEKHNEIVEAHLRCAEQMVQNMKFCVEQVFSNARYKYMITETGDVPVRRSSVGGGDWTERQHYSASKVVEGTNAP